MMAHTEKATTRLDIGLKHSLLPTSNCNINGTYLKCPHAKMMVWQRAKMYQKWSLDTAEQSYTSGST